MELAKTPAPFDVPNVTGTSEAAAADWQAAADLVASEAEAKAARRAAGNGSPTLNRSTFDFMREGATAGDRHRLLFSASANLGEFGCPPALANALLTEAGLDCGLSPSDVRRQIDCGLAAVASPSSPVPTQQASPESTEAAPDGSTVKEPPEAATSDSGDFDWQTGRQETGATVPAPAADLQAALARIWSGDKDTTVATRASDMSVQSTGSTGVEDVSNMAIRDIDDMPVENSGNMAVANVSNMIMENIDDMAVENSSDMGVQGTGSMDVEAMGNTTLQVALARLWRSPPAPVPLPPGAVGSGLLDTPCRCGSKEYADFAISEGRLRRDCRQCGRFISLPEWYPPDRPHQYAGGNGYGYDSKINPGRLYGKGG